MLGRIIILTSFIVIVLSHEPLKLNTEKFPDDFLFGVASSAYQTEGAWNVDGKGESIWDWTTHNRSDLIKDGSNGDIAADSYHKLEEDVALLKKLGVNVYRFSLAWTRILPNGYPNKINKAGINYYNRLIDALLENNITPMVSMFHWDLPLAFQMMGGFTNALSTEWFEAYAKVVFENFGDRVKLWTTFNEPKQICLFGYGRGTLAPALTLSGTGDYLCNHNLLLAHARAYHMYNKLFKPKKKGRIGIINECPWIEPASNLTEDIQAAERQIEFECGLYAQPIFSKEGDYPPLIKEMVANRSRAEGFTSSRLPTFTKEEVEYIRGTSDYFGLNYYTTQYGINKEADPIGEPSQDKDAQVFVWQDANWPGTPPFLDVPWGFRKILKWVKDKYQNPEIYIAETGFIDYDDVHDKGRITYHQGHLSTVLDAIYKDGVRVKSYIAWSLLDYFEWFSGYTFGFGFHHVDYSDPDRPRTAKDSAKFYGEVIRNRRLNIHN